MSLASAKKSTFDLWLLCLAVRSSSSTSLLTNVKFDFKRNVTTVWICEWSKVQIVIPYLGPILSSLWVGGRHSIMWRLALTRVMKNFIGSARKLENFFLMAGIKAWQRQGTKAYILRVRNNQLICWRAEIPKTPFPKVSAVRRYTNKLPWVLVTGRPSDSLSFT